MMYNEAYKNKEQSKELLGSYNAIILKNIYNKESFHGGFACRLASTQGSIMLYYVVHLSLKSNTHVYLYSKFA